MSFRGAAVAYPTSMPDASDHELFAVAAPGLERVVADELRRLRLKATEVPGGVTFRGTLEDAARVNLWSRTATRVLLRLGSFDAPGRRELAARAARLSLSKFIPEGMPIRVQASSAKSRLYHTGLITEVLHEAFARPVADKDEGAPLLLARFERDRCTLSLDTSGELLHRRGYREESAQAPLRETLAAALLLLCGYDGKEALLDPMCGSGTCAIEAGLIASGRAPGLERSFALEAFPSFDEAVLTRLRAEARELIHAAPAPIAASDIHAGSLAAARRNASRAHVEGIQFERVDVGERGVPAATGLLITNPPYGRRVGERDDDRSAAKAMNGLVAALSGPFSAWRAALLLPVSARLGLSRPVKREVSLDNGGIPVRLVELRAGGAG